MFLQKANSFPPDRRQCTLKSVTQPILLKNVLKQWKRPFSSLNLSQVENITKIVNTLFMEEIH